MPQKSCVHITILPPNLVIGSTNHQPQGTQNTHQREDKQQR